MFGIPLRHGAPRVKINHIELHNLKRYILLELVNKYPHHNIAQISSVRHEVGSWVGCHHRVPVLKFC